MSTEKKAGLRHLVPEKHTLKDLFDDFGQTADFTYELDSEGYVTKINGVGNDEYGYWAICKLTDGVEDPINDVIGNIALKDGDVYTVTYVPNLSLNGDWNVADIGRIASKGHCFEGPFYTDRKGRIIGYDQNEKQHAEKLVKREEQRLIRNFEKAKADGYERFVLFLHYPPTDVLEKDSAFTRLASRYNVSQVLYAHCHGKKRFHDSIEGKYRGRQYSLVSGDYLNWVPKKIL